MNLIKILTSKISTFKPLRLIYLICSKIFVHSRKIVVVVVDLVKPDTFAFNLYLFHIYCSVDSFLLVLQSMYLFK